MVEYLAMNSNKHLNRYLVLLLGMVIFLPISTAHAELLADPTLPPTSFYNNDVSQELNTGPVLQSVMIGKNYRAAIISGQKILLGKKYELATLIRLNEHEAVLQNPDMTTQILVMDYAIDKKVKLKQPAKTK